MKRSQFLKLSGASLAATTLAPEIWADPITRGKQIQELENHVIEHCELIQLKYHWPRFVGKNGRIDFHGQRKVCTALRLRTDQGASGWGLSNPNVETLFPQLQNKRVSELINLEIGIIEGLDRRVDFALHDLMGVILNQPVYKLIGNRGTKQVPIYSGMIYLDELNPGNEVKGIDAIIENCQWDVDYGYRQLKVKIGRSGRWYNHKEGLAKDIEVVKLIYDTFRDKGVEVLVDANDMYTLDDTMAFLEGIGDLPLYWVEEPFREEVLPGKQLRAWMNENGFKKTYYADGERKPDFDVCLELGQKQHMDIFLPDTYSYGFTNWIKLMPQLEKMNMLASPHAWGNRLKTHYTVHLAAGLGNICTVEGVTCLSDDIDYGDYPIHNGKVEVSDASGFGMKLLK